MSRTIFVSYSHAWEAFITQLLEQLKDEDFDVWTDKRIQEATPWVESIDNAIKDSFAVIVVMTKEAMTSQYVTYEWSMAMGLGLKILPILLDDDVKIHPKLEKLQHLDFRKANFNWEILTKRIGDLRKEFLNTPRAVNSTLNLLNEGRLQSSSNNLMDALDSLKMAEDHANDHLLDNIYYEMAMVYTRLEDEVKVEEFLNKSLKYNHQHIPSLVQLGTLHRKQADSVETKEEREKLLADAERCFRQALDIQPKLLDEEGEAVWGSLGGVLKRREQLDDAIDAYRKAAQIKRGSYPYNNLGLLYLEKDNMELTKQNFKLVELFTQTKLLFDPSDEWVHNDNFIAKVILEKTELAEEALSTLLILAPDYALKSLIATLNIIQENESFSKKVKDYVEYSIKRIQDRLDELSSPIE